LPKHHPAKRAPTIPDRPTKADAEAALASLSTLIDAFPPPPANAAQSHR
jgi:hypothetical protein